MALTNNVQAFKVRIYLKFNLKDAFPQHIKVNIGQYQVSFENTHILSDVLSIVPRTSPVFPVHPPHRRLSEHTNGYNFENSNSDNIVLNINPPISSNQTEQTKEIHNTPNAALSLETIPSIKWVFNTHPLI